MAYDRPVINWLIDKFGELMNAITIHEVSHILASPKVYKAWYDYTNSNSDDTLKIGGIKMIVSDNLVDLDSLSMRVVLHPPQEVEDVVF